NQRANQLARFLKVKGVRPDKIVGVYLDRSVEMIVSVLAVLKAGGAYLPMDPNYPIDRLKYVAEEAQLSVLITRDALSASAAELATDLVFVDADAVTISSQSTDDLTTEVSPENLAYVTFTSGSTGRAK